MISPVTLAFLDALQHNNHTSWMHMNRELYEQQRDEFKAFITQLIERFKTIDSNLQKVEAKNCIFRINRDIRFSKNKEPYKNNFWGLINEGGKKSADPGLYIHIEPGNKSMLAGGIYNPYPAELKKVRDWILKHYKKLEAILSDPQFKKFWWTLDDNQLVNVPRGYDREHPAASLLKYKHFVVIHHLKDSDVTKPDFLEYCVNAYKSIQPFNDFFKALL